MSNIKVSVDAVVEKDGETECTVSCNDRRARVVFAGDEVYVRIPQEGDGG